MLADILIGGVALVEQDDNSALSFVVQTVVVTTLHVVRDTVRAGTVIATDEWGEVTLLSEEFENAQHRNPTSDDVVLYPRNHQRHVPFTTVRVEHSSLPPSLSCEEESEGWLLSAPLWPG